MNILKQIYGNAINCKRGFEDYFFNKYVMNIPFHAIRELFLKAKLKDIGVGSTFLMGIEIRTGKNITVGNHTIINSQVLLDGRGAPIVIGNHVDIAQETNIWTLEHDVHDDFHAAKGAGVMIEDYVWIASRVTILPGVKIGRGAVVASGAIVTKDVAPMTIVGGIPAKSIGMRKSNLKYSLNYKPWFK